MGKTGTTKVSEAEAKKIFEYLDQGISSVKIQELTGRSNVTIYWWKKKWKENKMKEQHQEIEGTAEIRPKTTDKGIAESDYAKAYLSGDPRWSNSSLKIKKQLSIESSKTGMTYRIADGDFITMTNEYGESLKIDMKIFEAFTNEVVDVYIEANDYCKKK